MRTKWMVTLHTNRKIGRRNWFKMNKFNLRYVGLGFNGQSFYKVMSDLLKGKAKTR